MLKKLTSKILKKIPKNLRNFSKKNPKKLPETSYKEVTEEKLDTIFESINIPEGKNIENLSLKEQQKILDSLSQADFSVEKFPFHLLDENLGKIFNNLVEGSGENNINGIGLSKEEEQYLQEFFSDGMEINISEADDQDEAKYLLDPENFDDEKDMEW